MWQRQVVMGSAGASLYFLQMLSHWTSVGLNIAFERRVPLTNSNSYEMKVKTTKSTLKKKFMNTPLKFACSCR